MQHLPGAMRLFLLDASGVQISQNLCAPEYSKLDMRYKPLWAIRGATWYAGTTAVRSSPSLGMFTSPSLTCPCAGIVPA